MTTLLRIGCLVIALTLAAASGPLAQEAPAGGRLRLPPQPAQPPEPTARQSAERPAIVATAELVTTEARIDPAKPSAGQRIRVLAVIQNQGAAASQRLRFVVRCPEIRGGPTCPAKTFAATLAGLEPGRSARVMVDLGSRWAAGQYRLVTGTDVPREAKSLALAIQPAPILARADQHQARPRTDEARRGGRPTCLSQARTGASTPSRSRLRTMRDRVPQGYPFKGGQAEIPGLAVGQSTILTISMGPKEPFFLPGNQWAPFQWSDWLALYRGGKGPLRASLQTTEAIAELPTGGYKTTLGCSEEDRMDVQIPHQL